MKTVSTSVFAQFLNLIPKNIFLKFVEDIDGPRQCNSTKYNRWEQLVALIFSHIAQCDSLREIEEGLNRAVGKLPSIQAKVYKRSALSYRNSHDTYLVYEKLYHALVSRFTSVLGNRLGNRFKKPVYSLDSTTITLCLSLFDWAQYRRCKGGIKLHTLLNNQTLVPEVVDMTTAKVADIKMIDSVMGKIPSSCIVVMDRGYNDYKQFAWLSKRGTSFITRIKDNAQTTAYYKGLRAKGSNWGDYEISFTSKTALACCCGLKFRVIQWYDETSDKWFEFLTNDFDLSAEQIAELYRDRWQIELFFKKIKQNLKIKTFIGTSENAVMTQIWTAAICTLLIEILRHKAKYTEWSFPRLLRVITLSLMTYSDLLELIDKTENNETGPLQPENQRRKESFQLELWGLEPPGERVS